MTLNELFVSCRRTLDDTVGDDTQNLWKEYELEEYLNEAQNEFVKQTLCLRTSLDETLCQVPLVLGRYHYPINPRILQIDAVVPSWGAWQPLRDAVSYRNFVEPWQGRSGLPTAYCTNYENGCISFDQIPTTLTNESIRLSVRRMPLPMSISQGPEIRPEYHPLLRDYALYRAYDKQDVEAYDPARSAAKLAIWRDKVSTAAGQLGRLYHPVTRSRKIVEL